MASNDVVVRMVADIGNLQAGVKKIENQLSGLKGTTEKATSGISGSLKKVGSVVAGAFAIGKIIEFGHHMVEVTASVQALDSQFQQTFKNGQDKAMSGITAQAKEQGIHIDRLKGQWASFYGTFRGNGANANKSLELTTRYMHLAGDASAYYDKSLEDVSGRLKSIIMGNFEAGDAIGLNLNVTKLDTIAKQKYAKKWQDLNDTQKEFLILDTAEKIYENSGAMGQGAREAQNWENVTGNLKATWERLLSVIGSPVLAVATTVVVNLTDKIQFITTKVQLFADTYNKISEGGGDFFSNLAQTFDSLNLPILADLSSMLGDAVEGAKNFVEWFSQMGNGATVLTGILGTLGTLILAFNLYLKSGAIASGVMSTALGIQTAVTTALNVVTGVFSALMSFILSPIGLVIVAVGALVTAGVLLYKNWDTVCEYASKLGKWIGEVLDSVCKWASEKLNSLGQAVSEIWQSICECTSEVWNSICSTVSEVWNSICDGVSSGLEAVKEFIVSGWKAVQDVCAVAWDFIKRIVQFGILAIGSLLEAMFTIVTLPFRMVWENCKEYIISAWESIKTAVSNGINAVLGVISSILTVISDTVNLYWTRIKQNCSDIWEGIKNYFIGWFDWYVEIFTRGFNRIASVIMEVMTTVGDFLSSVWNSIKSTVSDIWESIKNYFIAWFNWYSAIISRVFNLIKSIITTVLTAIGSFISTIWEAIKKNTTTTWNGVKFAVTTVLTAVKSILTSVFTAIKNFITSIWNSVWSVTSSIWNSIKSSVLNAVHTVQAGISSIWNNIKSVTSSTWEGIKNAMWKPIQWAKNKIHDLIEGIKRMFNFHIELPKPKLPHFKIDGHFSLTPPSVPHLAVDWYATGGIATAPSIVGIGEAGDEAILPLSNKGRMKPFAKAVAEMMPDNIQRESSGSSGVSINIESLVVREEADVNRIAQQLYKLQERNRRARGKTY